MIKGSRSDLSKTMQRLKILNLLILSLGIWSCSFPCALNQHQPPLVSLGACLLLHTGRSIRAAVWWTGLGDCSDLKLPWPEETLLVFTSGRAFLWIRCSELEAVNRTPCLAFRTEPSFTTTTLCWMFGTAEGEAGFLSLLLKIPISSRIYK